MVDLGKVPTAADEVVDDFHIERREIEGGTVSVGIAEMVDNVVYNDGR